MRAEVGDWLIVRGNRVGDPNREAEILEVRGEDGAPPYLVRWFEDGHEALFFPAANAQVRHRAHEQPTAQTEG